MGDCSSYFSTTFVVRDVLWLTAHRNDMPGKSQLSVGSVYLWHLWQMLQIGEVQRHFADLSQVILGHLLDLSLWSCIPNLIWRCHVVAHFNDTCHHALHSQAGSESTLLLVYPPCLLDYPSSFWSLPFSCFLSGSLNTLCTFLYTRQCCLYCVASGSFTLSGLPAVYSQELLNMVR